jgi:hypothetical protein
MDNLTDVLAKIKSDMGDVSKYRVSSPEEDAARKAKYEADLAEKRSYLRGLRNAMAEECVRFNADWRFKPKASAITRDPADALVTQRERIQLTQDEWDALREQATYEMRTLSNHVSVVLRKHLGTIQGSSTKRPIGRPPAPKPPLYLQPWNPNIWEDDLGAWHTTAAERNPSYTAAEVRVAHDLYLATLFAHLQRVGFPHPFKAGFTAI